MREKGRRIMVERVIEVTGGFLKLFSDRPQGALLLKVLGSLPEDGAIRAIAEVLTREPLAGEAQQHLLAFGSTAVLSLMGILDITEDREKRIHILDILAQIGRGSTDLIAKRLDDDRWYVRRNVCLILARMGDQTTMSYLLPELKDRDPRVRFEAVRGISALGKGLAEEILIDALADKDRRVKEEVVKSLGRFGGKKAVLALSLLLSRRSLFLRSEQEGIRLAAARAMGEIRGADAEDALRRLIQSERNPEIKQAAEQSLAKLEERVG
jgi:HEAT repeat protein